MPTATAPRASALNCPGRYQRNDYALQVSGFLRRIVTSNWFMHTAGQTRLPVPMRFALRGSFRYAHPAPHPGTHTHGGAKNSSEMALIGKAARKCDIE